MTWICAWLAVAGMLSENNVRSCRGLLSTTDPHTRGMAMHKDRKIPKKEGPGIHQ